jgi:hypothetical protein
MVFREEIEVRLADGLGGVAQTESLGLGATGPQESTVQVLEVNAVRYVVQQRPKQELLVLELSRALPHPVSPVP